MFEFSALTWLVVWSIGWLLWLGYWCHVAVVGGESGEVSARGVKVAWVLWWAGIIGCASTAFLLPPSDILGAVMY